MCIYIRREREIHIYIDRYTVHLQSIPPCIPFRKERQALMGLRCKSDREHRPHRSKRKAWTGLVWLSSPQKLLKLVHLPLQWHHFLELCKSLGSTGDHMQLVSPLSQPSTQRRWSDRAGVGFLEAGLAALRRSDPMDADAAFPAWQPQSEGMQFESAGSGSSVQSKQKLIESYVFWIREPLVHLVPRHESKNQVTNN